MRERKTTPADLTILIELPDSKAARTVRESIAPETVSGKGFRSKTTVSAKGNRLRIRITARDLVALRAASNSFLHFTSVALKGVSIVAPFYRAGRKVTPRRRVP